MRKKFDWNVPMTRKNWLIVYLTCILCSMSYLALIAINIKKAGSGMKKIKKEMMENPKF